MKPRILNVSLDESLRTTRERLLQDAGYSVVSASSWIEFEQACAGYSFDLILLGQTLPPSLKHDMADHVQNHCPDVKLAEIYLHGASVPAKYSFHAAGTDASDFLKFVDATLAEKK